MSLGTMNILPAKPSEAELLTRIAFAAKSHWGYPARWLALWEDVLTITPAFIVSHPTYAAHGETEIVGFSALRRGETGLSLEHLWVLPTAMSCGVGGALFRHARQSAAEWGFASLEWESDPHAAGFYEHMGACRIGTRLVSTEGHPRELPLFRCATTFSPATRDT